MRTYDKLIATICTGQGNGGLRSSFGLHSVGVACVAHRPAASQQDTA